MATQNLVPLLVVGTLSGNAPEIREYPEAASQTFVKGEAVYLDGAGRVAEFTASVDDGSTRFLGFAAGDGSNTTAGAVNTPVYIANDDTIFEGNIYHGTAASAITALTDVATLLPLKQLTTTGLGIIAVDKEDTASQIDSCRIIQLSPKDTVGDTYGRVWFVIEAAARLFRR